MTSRRHRRALGGSLRSLVVETAMVWARGWRCSAKIRVGLRAVLPRCPPAFAALPLPSFKVQPIDSSNRDAGSWFDHAEVYRLLCSYFSTSRPCPPPREVVSYTDAEWAEYKYSDDWSWTGWVDFSAEVDDDVSSGTDGEEDDEDGVEDDGAVAPSGVPRVIAAMDLLGSDVRTMLMAHGAKFARLEAKLDEHMAVGPAGLEELARLVSATENSLGAQVDCKFAELEATFEAMTSGMTKLMSKQLVTRGHDVGHE